MLAGRPNGFGQEFADEGTADVAGEKEIVCPPRPPITNPRRPGGKKGAALRISTGSPGGKREKPGAESLYLKSRSRNRRGGKIGFSIRASKLLSSEGEKSCAQKIRPPRPTAKKKVSARRDSIENRSRQGGGKKVTIEKGGTDYPHS